MASKNSATPALFFALNILFFTLTAATDCRCSPSSKPRPVLAPSFPRPSPRPLFPKLNPRPLVPSTNPRPLVSSPSVTSPNPRPLVPSPSMPSPNPRPLVPSPSVPSPSVPSPSVPSPLVPSSTTPGSSGNCPIDALRLGVCANVLSGLLNVQLGQPSAQPCCSVIEGSVCLCTALRANVLGINLNVPISLSVLLNVCNKNLPSGFQCT